MDRIRKGGQDARPTYEKGGRNDDITREHRLTAYATTAAACV